MPENKITRRAAMGAAGATGVAVLIGGIRPTARGLSDDGVEQAVAATCVMTPAKPGEAPVLVRGQLDVVWVRRREHHVARADQLDRSLVGCSARRRTERAHQHDPHSVGVVGVRPHVGDVSVEHDDLSWIELACRHRIAEREAKGLLPFVAHEVSVRRSRRSS